MTALSATIQLHDTQKMTRDRFSKALLSTDTTGLQAYKAQRRSTEQLLVLQTDINTVQLELAQMKELLAKVLHQHNA